MKINKENGYSELIITDDCDFDEFYAVASNLCVKLNTQFIEKVEDFDSLYYTFKYKSYIFILYYNIYFGITIYPKNAKNSNIYENNLITELYNEF
jgi:hypothetical protein